MLPVIVVESLVSPFKFWHGNIHSGMLYRNDFFACVQQFSVDDRSRAYARAIEEGKPGYKVCITVSKTTYTVWVEMRSRLPYPANDTVLGPSGDSAIVDEPVESCVTA
ncbi:hypothetical protein VB780_28220 [Leptolyngbya sp. CCNP1308]|uniref:hypothetical protein n=1 Tax=Leptolyngbya sp. CCNP1308 TaxID=3110255 RepID=UPI002B2042D8|nr:hypothetical protein [Leptolyngbya sp. CCNP1308]MEA5452492.1 hypothetical protein [Leptolyngbya sp. CCNP1308]